MNVIKQYVNAVERRLRLDRQTKLRVMNDLASDLQSRLDAGETLAEIEADLGSPAELAANLNAAFPEHQRPASPWRWLFAAAAALLALWMALASMPAQTSGIIGGADGPTAIVVTASGPDFSLFGLFCALAAAFLYLGWCRCGRPRRYGAAIARFAWRWLRLGCRHFLPHSALFPKAAARRPPRSAVSGCRRCCAAAYGSPCLCWSLPFGGCAPPAIARRRPADRPSLLRSILPELRSAPPARPGSGAGSGRRKRHTRRQRSGAKMRPALW